MSNTQSFKLTGSNQQDIIGDITYSKSESKQVALFVHGFKGFKDWGTHHLVAGYFAQNDVTYVKFNFSHSGVVASNLNDVTDMELFASNTPSKELYDLDIVIQYISETFPDAEISLIGHSRGGGLSILEAARNPKISKLITWAAISSFNSLWKKEQEEEWHEKGKIEVYNARTKEYMPLNVALLEDVNQNRETLNIMKAAKNISIPWLIIHGNDDVNVVVEIAKNFKAIHPEASFLEINGANHVFGASHPYSSETLPLQLLEVSNASLAFIKSES
ncbi:MAG: alpha/beta hydrolase [Pedobacter sp.]|nr:MAG: alpha/beta hydrolase [Pedobacter sp.]